VGPIVDLGRDPFTGKNVHSDAQHTLGLLRRLAQRIADGDRRDSGLP
jgi:hypothetical protein